MQEGELCFFYLEKYNLYKLVFASCSSILIGHARLKMSRGILVLMHPSHTIEETASRVDGTVCSETAKESSQSESSQKKAVRKVQA